MSENKLKKLKDSIDRESSVLEKDKTRSRSTADSQEETDRIIQRLKSNKKPSKPVKSVADLRLAELKSRIEGRIASQKLDFSKAVFSKSKPHTTAEGMLSFVGSVYASLEAPVTAVASTFSKLPIAQDLQTDLNAADFQVSAETYLVACSVFSILIGIIVLIVTAVVTAIFSPNLIFVFVPLGTSAFVVAGVLSLLYPSMRAKERARLIDRELPFALRHLSSQVKAGVSFHRALKSVAKSNYGLLSFELRRVLRDLERGSGTNEALLALSQRTKSKGLRKALIQIIRALKTGGNLSQIISDIAADVAFESRMLVRDFVETLNIVNVFYIMISVVAPVIITILTSVTQLPMIGVSLSPLLVILIFTIDAFAMFGMVVMIRKMEPG
ncbi:MAG: type II secretion system F family protein [Candidatus Micrarchaeia archaeon]